MKPLKPFLCPHCKHPIPDSRIKKRAVAMIVRESPELRKPAGVRTAGNDRNGGALDPPPAPKPATTICWRCGVHSTPEQWQLNQFVCPYCGRTTNEDLEREMTRSQAGGE